MVFFHLAERWLSFGMCDCRLRTCLLLRAWTGVPVNRIDVRLPPFRQLEHVTHGSDGRSADDILQLTHVAGPTILLQRCSHLTRYLAKALPQPPPRFL